MNGKDEIPCPACGWDAEAEGIVLIPVEPCRPGETFEYFKFYCGRCERRTFVEKTGFKTP